MPKRFLLALAVASIVVAACKSGTTTPTPSGSPGTPHPNPSITAAAVQVTLQGTPAPHVPVSISTPRNPNSPRPGTPFFTKKTGPKGFATFTKLKPSKTYCWVATISSSFTSSLCADWEIWQSGTIFLGN